MQESVLKVVAWINWVAQGYVGGVGSRLQGIGGGKGELFSNQVIPLHNIGVNSFIISYSKGRPKYRQSERMFSLPAGKKPTFS